MRSGWKQYSNSSAGSNKSTHQDATQTHQTRHVFDGYTGKAELGGEGSGRNPCRCSKKILPRQSHYYRLVLIDQRRTRDVRVRNPKEDSTSCVCRRRNSRSETPAFGTRPEGGENPRRNSRRGYEPPGGMSVGHKIPSESRGGCGGTLERRAIGIPRTSRPSPPYPADDGPQPLTAQTVHDA